MFCQTARRASFGISVCFSIFFPHSSSFLQSLGICLRGDKIKKKEMVGLGSCHLSGLVSKKNIDRISFSRAINKWIVGIKYKILARHGGTCL